MALIAKIDPPLAVSEEGHAQIHARPYRKPDLMDGAEIFVWTSETAGGHGLVARARVLSSRIEEFPNLTGDGQHKELVLDIEVLDQSPRRSLTLDQIAVKRDAQSPSPEREIAQVIYKHALNKITMIESDVADFVRSHFEE